jgi:hypothetical protein
VLLAPPDLPNPPNPPDGLSFLHALSAFRNLGLFPKPPAPGAGPPEPKEGGVSPPVGGPPGPPEKFGRVTPCCFRQAVYAAWDGFDDLPELVPAEVEGEADELPQAARINGTTQTNVTIPMTDVLRLRHLSRRVARTPDCESTRSLRPVMVFLMFLIGPHLEGPK